MFALIALIIAVFGVLTTGPAKRAPKIARQFISMADAADYLGGVSVDTIRRRIAAGYLTGYRMPGSRLVFVKLADLEALIISGEIPTAGRAK